MKTKLLLTALLFLTISTTAQTYWHQNGITVAGGNGSGSGANQLSGNEGIAVDNSGNIYITDGNNNRIQKWTPGAVSGVTVAGGNGSGSAANQFKGPKGICVDNNGYLYITDYGNNRVQKWQQGATSGVTIAGSTIGNSGSSDSLLHGPIGLSIDQTGNIYIADYYNNRIQKWETAAITGVTVAGGNGQGSGANQLSEPTGVYLDNNGAIYVLDNGNSRVQKWTPNSTNGITVAGGNGTGTADNQLSYPNVFWIDNQKNIYVGDGNARVQLWEANATTGRTIVGGNGFGSAANQINGAFGIALDGNNSLYVSDMENNRVQKFTDSATTGVNNITMTSSKYKIWPNPSSGFFNVYNLTADYSKSTLEVINMSGQIVYVNENAFVSKNNETINVANINAGTIYLF